jgi:hypothetical protein
MKSHGDLTAKVGESLRKDLASKGYEVLHDHGAKAKHVGKIVSWFGTAKAPTRETALSQMDIAVVEQKTWKALALIEIEETSNRPKSVLGDVFGALVGDRVTFRGKTLKLGPWTTLIVMSSGTASQRPRNELIARNAKASQASMPGENAHIGKIVLESFASDAGLESKLKALIEGARKANAAK